MKIKLITNNNINTYTITTTKSIKNLKNNKKIFKSAKIHQKLIIDDNYINNYTKTAFNSIKNLKNNFKNHKICNNS